MRVIIRLSIIFGVIVFMYVGFKIGQEEGQIDGYRYGQYEVLINQKPTQEREIEYQDEIFKAKYHNYKIGI